MQVVCSQRMSVPFTSDPVELYRSIRHLNPSPYLYYLNLEEFHIVGSSPEILARLENGEVTVRPIAGTRRRGKDDIDDIAMEEDMVNDPKEIAEHLMLIDLGRNDIGRIAEPVSYTHLRAHETGRRCNAGCLFSKDVSTFYLRSC